MTTSRPEEEVIFHAARDIPDPDRRRAYVHEACRGDETLISQIEALLAIADVPDRLLDRAPAELLGGGDTQPAAIECENLDLDFLTPSHKPGVLGRLEHYDILEVVGKGGMGTVLRAFDDKLHRVVAIKVLAAPLATSTLARKRFTREAQAQAAVCHDHIVTIHAVEEPGGGRGLPYLVMQYVAGLSLQQRLDRDGPLELQEILRIGMQTASGLAAAHAQGLIHRDIKPANILLENGVERVKITDFGLARVANEASVTQSGVVVGTPHYMSPEQAEGKPLDQRTDLFSLGSVLYAMCTGRAPFRASGTMAVLKRVCEETPTPIRDVNPAIPDWLVAIVSRLHAKEPAERFQSAAEVAELLGQHLAHVQHPSVVEHVSNLPVERPAGWKPAPRRRRWAVAAAAVILLLGGLSLTEATGVSNLRATVIRIFTPDGTLVVEVDDPGVKVTIEGDGGLVITGAGLEEIRLRPGNYRLKADKGGKPVPLDKDLVTVSRGGRAIVKVKLEASPAAASANAEKGAFVLLAAGKERKFDTLAEAVLTSSDGDTIEVRGNGPFATQPVAIKNRALTIRAGEGFRPVIKADPDEEEKDLLSTNAPLVLEGLDFQWVDAKAFTPQSRNPRLVVATGSTSRLQVANCRFLMNRREGRHDGMECIGALDTPLCRLRNCQLLIGGRGTVWGSNLGVRCIPNGEVMIDNCLIVGNGMLLQLSHSEPMKVVQNHNTYLGSPSSHVSMRPTKKIDPPPGKVNPRPLQIETSANIFSGPVWFSQFTSFLATALEAEQFLTRLIGWRENRNLYLLPEDRLLLHLNVEMVPGKYTSLPLTAPLKTLGDWQRFWGMGELDSFRGQARFQGGDLLTKAGLTPDLLTPEDFRLRPDSPGYRAGKDGKDLGADVTLAGPGPAYERWKQTPEYQQWLKDSGQLKETGARPNPLRLVQRFEDNNAAWINAIQFAPNSDRSIITSLPSGIDVWDRETGAKRKRILTPGELRSLGFIGDGTRLVGVTFKGELLGLEWPSGQVMFAKPAHKPAATAGVMLSQSRFASTGHDSIVRIWDARTGEKLQELLPSNPASPGQNYSLAVSPDERHVVAGGSSHVSVWNLPDGRFVRDLGMHPFNVFAVAISPDNRHVLTGGQMGLVQQFELDTGKLVREFDKHTGPVASLVFLPDGLHFVSGATDGTLRVWSINGQEAARHVSSKNDVSRLAVTSDGRHVLSAGTGIGGPTASALPTDATLQLWKLPASVWPVAARPDPAPFVVLTGKGIPVRPFATLAEAVAATHDGDIIEVRGNGPFVTPPIVIRRPLTIRAGAGFWPVIKADPDEQGAILLDNQSSLALEGLDLHWVDAPAIDEAQLAKHLLVCRWPTSRLHVANCRFLMNRREGTHSLMSCIAVWTVAFCQVRNSQFVVGGRGTLGGNNSVYFSGSPQGELLVDNCLVVGHAVALTINAEPTRAVLARNTFLGFSQFVKISLYQKIDAPLEEKPVPLLQIRASANIFDGIMHFYQFPGLMAAGKTWSTAEAEKLLPKLVAWREGRNLYLLPNDKDLLLLASKPPPEKPTLVPSLLPTKTMADWKTFWGMEELDSQRGQARFQGGDLATKAMHTPDVLTPDDFRLRPDSPGYRAGKDGKDLGADVDLVGPGPAYERWKKTPEYQQWLMDTRQLRAEAPKPEPKAFVVMGGKGVAERMFDTLAEAARNARDGDTIEVRGNGPFVIDPVTIRIALRIRAADGFRPVLRLSEAGARTAQPVLETHAPLILEGLELQRIGVLSEGSTRGDVVVCRADSLHVANCRFLCDVPQPLRSGYCVTAYSQRCSLRNSEFITRNGFSFQYVSRLPGQFVMDNCVGSTGAFAWEGSPADARSAQLRHNTIVGVSLSMRFRDTFLAGEDTEPGIAIQSTGNVFGDPILLHVEGIEPARAKATLPQRLTWQEVDSLYPVENLLTANSGSPQFTSLIRGEKGLEEWRRLWKLADGQVTVGVPRFRGDYRTKLAAAPAEITPDDFRLHPDSPGYRAGKDGKDLGADVDLVGPGAAYERWKKTPEYQQWRKDTGQPKDAETVQLTPEACERESAEFLLPKGVKLHLESQGKPRVILDKSGQPLPAGKWNVVEVQAFHLDKFTVGDLALLRNFPQLRGISLVGNQVSTAALLDQVEGMGLTLLILNSVPTTAHDVVRLAKFTELYHLLLYDTGLSDDEVALLAKLPLLKNVNCGGNAVTDRSLEYLSGCPKLRMLHMANTKVTDVGLTHLHKCKSLQFLDVSGTSVSSRGVEDLRKALPGCEVKADGLSK